MQREIARGWLASWVRRPAYLSPSVGPHPRLLPPSDLHVPPTRTSSESCDELRAVCSDQMAAGDAFDGPSLFERR